MVECGLLMRIVVLYQYVCMSITSISLERNLPAIAKPLSAGCKNAAELPFYFKTLELLAAGAGVSDFAETGKKTYAKFIDMFDSLITGELMDGSGFVEEKFPDEEWADLDAEQPRYMPQLRSHSQLVLSDVPVLPRIWKLFVLPRRYMSCLWKGPEG